MRDGELGFAVVSGVLVVACALVGGVRRDDPLPAMTDGRSMVGRTAEEVATGLPPARFRHIRKTTPAELLAQRRAAMFDRFDDTLGRPVRTTGFKRVVVHVLAAELPKAVTEEGPAWHVVVRRDGAVASTERWRKGRAGAPVGLPIREATDAVHVMIPFVRKEDPDRKRALSDLLGWLERTLERRLPVLLASQVTGATATLPPGIEATDVLQKGNDR
ncbi:MAG: hypothetical protein CMJ83_04500 [Planctomycetes bacterium]|nr:hypothetical protein [Planctomycetota bacterium]